MILSDLSIKRPVLATVLSLLIVLAGVAAFRVLPVREYPDVENPLVSVNTLYVGASPETVESTVTVPLEEALNGIEGVRTITSTSAFGVSSIQIEFIASREIDAAATDVTNAVQSALGKIPSEAERPIIRKTGIGGRAIMWLAVQGEGYSPTELTDIADRVVKTPLQVLPGVANIVIGGQRKYAMRVWLDPGKMAARGVDPRDVRQALLENNLQLPAGRVEGESRKFTILADAQIADPALYAGLIVRSDAAGPVRISDVGSVELGADNYQTVTRFGGEPTIGVGVIRQSRSNELEVSAAVRRLLPEIRGALPDGVTLKVAVDQTIFVDASLEEVWGTLAIAFALVVLVNLIFLRSLATTVIASIAIPASAIGTFAIMEVLGFSVNVLTLLALVLAIGLLVDDAIVVLENIYRHQELGEAPHPAAVRGAREVGFAVVATTVSLIAVLIPLSLLTGTTGRLFREFSITVAAAVAISTFVALTLIPMLCANFLRFGTSHGRLYNLIEDALEGARAWYGRALSWALEHRAFVVGFLAFNAVASVGLYGLLPKELSPVEDRGQFLVVVKAPQGSTLAYTDQTLRGVERAVAAVPEVEGYFTAIGLSIGGPSSTSSAIMFSRLRRWSDRDVKQQLIVKNLFPQLFALPGAKAFPVNRQSLGQSSFQDVAFVIKNSSATLEEFAFYSEEILSRAREQMPALLNLDSDLLLDDPQLRIDFDRDRAADLGLSVREIAEALRTVMAQSKVSEFTLRNKQYDVIASLYPRFQSEPGALGRIQLRNQEGKMVPLENLVRVEAGVAPAELSHYGLERSATLTASLGEGLSLGEAISGLEAIAKEVLPPGFTTALTGASREFAESSADLLLTFVLALVFIYLVLSAQFENFIHPLTILLSVPLAILGALLTLWLFGQSMNIYSQIGMVLLIGLVSKNSILLVDYANQFRARGGALLDSVIEAGKIRFRPILMTSTTSILGAVPLALAAGAGAESRHPIGAAVVGGLFFSTVFTLLVIPVVYLLLVGLAERVGLKTIPPAIELGRGESET